MIISRYYKELALPHLIKFPVREVAQSTGSRAGRPRHLGLRSPVENIDWMATLTASPVVIPGFTTRERVLRHRPRHQPGDTSARPLFGRRLFGLHAESRAQPFPIRSWPPTIIALSALRARPT